MKYLKILFLPVLFMLVFVGIALWRYFATGKIFYLINFGYIGFSLALGLLLANILPKRKIGTARRIAQLLIGLYLLVYVGIIAREDLQIEGFWIYLFSGYFAGATLHYLIAKIFGTVLFGRGWCGWACWSAMVFDLMPWKIPQNPVNRKMTALRYVHFIIIGVIMAIFVLTFLILGGILGGKEIIELRWLLIGNILYYLIGIILAALLRDNRAFCKYVCPIPVFMKIGSRFSLLKKRNRSAKMH